MDSLYFHFGELDFFLKALDSLKGTINFRSIDFFSILFSSKEEFREFKKVSVELNSLCVVTLNFARLQCDKKECLKNKCCKKNKTSGLGSSPK